MIYIMSRYIKAVSGHISLSFGLCFGRSYDVSHSSNIWCVCMGSFRVCLYINLRNVDVVQSLIE